MGRELYFDLVVEVEDRCMWLVCGDWIDIEVFVEFS